MWPLKRNTWRGFQRSSGFDFLQGALEGGEPGYRRAPDGSPRSLSSSNWVRLELSANQSLSFFARASLYAAFVVSGVPTSTSRSPSVALDQKRCDSIRPGFSRKSHSPRHGVHGSVIARIVPVRCR